MLKVLTSAKNFNYRGIAAFIDHEKTEIFLLQPLGQLDHKLSCTNVEAKVPSIYQVLIKYNGFLNSEDITVNM
jgi:hypothetical protein